MIVRTRVFDLRNEKYENLSELARAMGISASQVYRVREGKRHINEKFIIGAVKAFPECRFSDLFYIAPKSPDGNTSKTTVTITYHRQRSVTQKG